jgi:signal transduction histidine kinase
MAIVLMSCVLFFSYKILYQAWKNKQNGVWIIAGAFLCLIISTVTWILYSRFSQNYWLNLFDSVLFYLIYGSIPIGLTAFMASRFRDLYTHLEQKVHDRTLALEQSLEDLKSTQTQLIHSEKMASLGALTAGIAHEIQNPLNFVNNFSEVNQELIGEMEEEIDKGNLVEAKKIAGSIRENQQKINQHGKRADNIVKGMLQHSRSSSGIKELVDINKLADEFLRLSYHGLRAKDKSFNASLKTDFDSSIGKINIVSEEIGRVILNLLNNAFYAITEKKRMNPEGYEPTVSINTRKVGDKIQIEVKDNGNGIPQNVLDKIFQPFFTTKPTGQGTGLGLSLAYDMVKTHGGELKVETKEGDGSEFCIQLPIK